MADPQENTVPQQEPAPPGRTPGVGPGGDRDPEMLRMLAEHRRARAAMEARRAEEEARLNVPRINPVEWMGKNPDSRRALQKMRNPEVRRRVEAALAEAAKEAFREAAATRASNRFNSYRVGRPAMFATAAYEDLDPAARDQVKVRRWWKSGAKTLVLAGLTGRGKTHAAYAICNEVAIADRDGKAEVPVTVRAHQAARIRDLLKPPDVHLARDDVESGRRARERDELTSCGLLLIDDITAAQITDWFREEMHKIIDTRVTAGLRTIVTLNGSSKDDVGREMVQRLGAPIVSRLRDDAVFVWLEGVDRRQLADWDPFADDEGT